MKKNDIPGTFKCQNCGKDCPIEDAKRVIAYSSCPARWVCPQCEPIVRDRADENLA